MTQQHSPPIEGYDAGFAAAKEELRAERIELRQALQRTIYYEFECQGENEGDCDKECMCGADDLKKHISEVLKKYWEMR